MNKNQKRQNEPNKLSKLSQLKRQEWPDEFVWQDEEKTPVLRFSPTAWAKLLFFRDKGETEIGGFGITAPDDLLYVQEFITVKQKVTIASVSFDDPAVADFFEDQVDRGRKPEQFARIWAHTHPGNSPEPSGTDEETFTRVFGRSDWAVMFILAQDDSAYAQLRFNIGPGGQMEIPVQVDFSKPFTASDQDVWEAEYQVTIHAERLFLAPKAGPVIHGPWFGDEKDEQEDVGIPELVLDDLPHWWNF
jgi:proteasome lid subunit RPN8/RPN11